jgi:hypothetical protein
MAEYVPAAIGAAHAIYNGYRSGNLYGAAASQARDFARDYIHKKGPQHITDYFKRVGKTSNKPQLRKRKVPEQGYTPRLRGTKPRAFIRKKRPVLYKKKYRKWRRG